MVTPKNTKYCSLNAGPLGVDRHRVVRCPRQIEIKGKNIDTDFLSFIKIVIIFIQMWEKVWLSFNLNFPLNY